MRVVLYGVGTPYVYEVAESLGRLGWEMAALIANLPEAEAPRPDELGTAIEVGSLHDDLQDGLRALPVTIPLLTPGFRKRLWADCRQLGFVQLATILDPSAVIAASAEIGTGTHVNAGAVVGAKARIGRLCVVNRSASVGHHAVLHDHATLGPGCVLCGHTVIGAGSFVGAGAVINPKVAIGANAIVGSGAVVTRDVPPHTVVVGQPARVIREDIPGYGDVSV